MGVAAHISFTRGFLGYLNEQGIERAESLLPALSAAYQQHGNWDFLRRQSARMVRADALGARCAVRRRVAARHPARARSDRRKSARDAARRRSPRSDRPAERGPRCGAARDRRGRPYRRLARCAAVPACHGECRRTLSGTPVARDLDHRRAVGLARRGGGDVARAHAARAGEAHRTARRTGLAAGEYDDARTGHVARRDRRARAGLQSPGADAASATSSCGAHSWPTSRTSCARRSPCCAASSRRSKTAYVRLSPESLESLQAEVDMLTKLVSDLYDLSLSDVGALTYRKVDVDLTEVLRARVGHFPRSPRQRSASASNRAAARASRSSCSPTKRRLRQLFSNLLENSLRYTDPGGVVKVECTRGRTTSVADRLPGLRAGRARRVAAAAVRALLPGRWLAQPRERRRRAGARDLQEHRRSASRARSRRTRRRSAAFGSRVTLPLAP